MASQNDNGFATYVASGALSAFRAVDVQSDGTIGYANANRGIGVLQSDVVDAGYGTVKLWTAAGTFMLAATGTAITPGTTYSIVTSGYVGATTTGYSAYVKGLQTAVASNGITVEFAANF
jgi:hypothetical protein